MLLPAEDVRDQALGILRAQREALHAQGISGELQLVGGSSVLGGLTRGDVDLHLTVATDAFPGTVAELGRLLPAVKPEIWGPTLATFAVPAALPTGLAVTPVGSEHDLRFTRTWQLLSADPALLLEYNAMKAAHDEGPEYERQKAAFFDRLVEQWPRHPAGGGNRPSRGATQDDETLTTQELLDS
jgi:hypothetical protein